ncbi:MAG: hypothetical protein IJ125_01430 [Atopobiaceae bacterium]|nr:hypothetical protein [Atopobiaceae bacterium]
MSQYPNSHSPKRPNDARSDEFGELQGVVDSVFSANQRMVSRLDVIICAEANDLSDDLLEVVGLLPPGHYTRARLCDQLNSTIAARGWGRSHGIVS